MEQTILSWAPLLKEQGIAVSYGAPPDGLFAEELARRGYDHEPIRFPAHRGLRAGESRRFAGPLNLSREVGVVGMSTYRVARVLRRYDMAHSHSLFGHLEAALAGRIARRPVLLHIHDIVQPGVGRTLLDRAVALSSRTYAITAAVRDCISPALHQKVVVQHHGLDLEQFTGEASSARIRHELGAEDGDVLVGMLGRIDRPKGVD
ncbi:MAG: glycosyltransferase, partial [Acidimicrobiales bacterium]